MKFCYILHNKIGNFKIGMFEKPLYATVCVCDVVVIYGYMIIFEPKYNISLN